MSLRTRMFKAIPLFFASIILCTIISCKKECDLRVTPDYNDCPPAAIDYLSCETLPDHNSLITTFKEVGQQYMLPYFNPNNADEFVYLERNIAEEKYDLIVYNMVTESKTTLAQNVRITSQPKWSVSNWIAYSTTGDNFISLVRFDGSDFTMVAENFNTTYLAWSCSGNALYFSSGDFVFKLDVVSNQVDTTFYNNTQYQEISNTNNLFGQYFTNDGKFFGMLNLDNSDFFATFGLIWYRVNLHFWNSSISRWRICLFVNG